MPWNLYPLYSPAQHQLAGFLVIQGEGQDLMSGIDNRPDNDSLVTLLKQRRINELDSDFKAFAHELPVNLETVGVRWAPHVFWKGVAGVLAGV
ncbi:hypothetical protein XarzCFBP7410_09190 [Xanthomonas arboricola pv. zantedeschiae]|nr:hypothetical protein XarzCFBP7410_09190 [Xanthomonas arboricola pv. zantedeschiae]